MDSVDQAIARADREWRAYGVSPSDRSVLATDLRLDLQSAAADGATPEQMLGADIGEFARRLADEAGVPLAPPAYGRVVRTALAGLILGLGVGFVVEISAHQLLVAWFDLPFEPPLWLAMLVFFGTIGAFGVAGAVVAVRVRLAGLPGIRRTARAMILLLPAAGAIATTVIWWFATALDRVGDPHVGNVRPAIDPAPLVERLQPVLIALAAAFAVAAAAGAVILARWWSLRDGGDRRRGGLSAARGAAARRPG